MCLNPSNNSPMNECLGLSSVFAAINKEATNILTHISFYMLLVWLLDIFPGRDRGVQWSIDFRF